VDKKFTTPKGFGEILDHTFQLTKNRFKDLFMILLIFMGPVYLLQAILQLLSGTSFFREVGSGGAWFEQILSSFEETGTFDSSSLGADIGLIVVGLISAILAPVAEAAILFTINHVRKNEDYTVGSVIKQAFSRFWPMIGSSILFFLITIGIIIIPIAIVGVIGGVVATMVNTVLGILLGVVLFLGFAVGIGLLLTRWSFYFGSVVLDKDSPGLGRSWRLSRKRTWALMGLYIVFYFIISSISFGVQMTLEIVLGNSVLLTLISNLVTLVTTMIFSVGYGVMYLDLKTRNDADDIKEMLEDYKTI
jgi:membrane-anchored glycerophosphoryl diester phosphodiesterase (GDPDase)